MKTRLPLLLVLLAGCFNPDYGDGEVVCGAGGLCPSGYVCGSDNRCHRGGAAVDASAVDVRRADASVVDAPPDAPPDAHILAICEDGVDNDGDGLTDYPSDLGCTSIDDDDETNPACIDGTDNDGDGLTDYPGDLGCLSSEDDDETNPACVDGLDNDLDGDTDSADPGCGGPGDDDEVDECVGSLPIVIDGSGPILATTSSSVRGLTALCGAPFELGVGHEATFLFQPTFPVANVNVSYIAHVQAVIGVLADACDDSGAYITCSGAPPGALNVAGLGLAAAGRSYWISIDTEMEPSDVLVWLTGTLAVNDLCDPMQPNFACAPGTVCSADLLGVHRCLPECGDLMDDDGDGAIDLGDTGCVDTSDLSEITCGSPAAQVVPLMVNNGFTQTYATPTAIHHGLSSVTCGGAGLPEDVYAITIPDDLDPGQVNVQVNANGATDTITHVRQGCGGAEITCNDNASSGSSSVTFDVVAGATYLVFVELKAGYIGYNISFSYRGAVGDACDPLASTCTGAACVHIGGGDFECANPACTDGIDNDADTYIDYGDPGCLSYQGFSEDEGCGGGAPFTVLSGTTVADTTVGAPDALSPPCAAGDGPERIYAFALTRPVTRLIATTAGSSLDTVLHVRSRPCDVVTDASWCNDNDGATTSSRVEVVPPTLFVGSQWLYFVVGGAGGASGDFVLSVTARLGLRSACTAGDPVYVCEDGLSCNGGLCVGACGNGVDDDGDTLVDGADPGCYNRDDSSEVNPTPAAQCADGIDNDADGFTDFGGGDPHCFQIGDTTEGAAPPASGVVTGDTSITANSSESCGFPTGSGDDTFTVTMPGTGTLTASLCFGSPFDSTVEIFDATRTIVDVCNDWGNCNDGFHTASATATIPVAGPYSIKVDGWGATHEGPFTLTVTGTLDAGQPCSLAQPYLGCATGTTCSDAGTPGLFTCK